MLTGCKSVAALLVKRLNRFCATACVPDGNTAKTFSTRMLEAGPGAWTAGLGKAAPAKQAAVSVTFWPAFWPAF